MKIPKIFHQTWKNRILPGEFELWSNTWKKINPEFQYFFYTDRDCFKLVAIHYPEYLDFWENLQGIEKIDVFRYLVLHKFGGVYIDMDCECLKPIGPLLDLFNKSLITGYEYENPVQYLQWFIACPRNCRTMIELVDEVYKRSWYKWYKALSLTENRLVYWFTGPEMYTEVLKKTQESVVVLEKGRLGCYDRKLIDVNSYLIHHFSGSWKRIKCKPI